MDESIVELDWQEPEKSLFRQEAGCAEPRRQALDLRQHGIGSSNLCTIIRWVTRQDLMEEATRGGITAWQPNGGHRGGGGYGGQYEGGVGRGQYREGYQPRQWGNRANTARRGQIQRGTRGRVGGRPTVNVHRPQGGGYGGQYGGGSTRGQNGGGYRPRQWGNPGYPPRGGPAPRGSWGGGAQLPRPNWGRGRPSNQGNWAGGGGPGRGGFEQGGDSRGPREDMTCFECRSSEHWLRDCPNRRCNYCKGRGHIKYNCKKYIADYNDNLSAQNNTNTQVTFSGPP